MTRKSKNQPLLIVAAVLLWGSLALVFVAGSGDSVAINARINNQSSGARQVIIVVDGREYDRDQWISPDRTGYVPVASGDDTASLRGKTVLLFSVDREGVQREFWSGTTDDLIDRRPVIVIRE